jgi:Acyltransferase C-terminus
MFDVASDVPIGSMSAKDAPVGDQPDDIEFSEEDRSQFDLWLRELWQDKDNLISTFHESETFVPHTKKSSHSAVVIPMKLHNKLDILNAFCFGGPALVGYIWAKLTRS